MRTLSPGFRTRPDNRVCASRAEPSRARADATPALPLRPENAAHGRAYQGDYLSAEQHYHPPEVCLDATQPVVVIVLNGLFQRAQVCPHSPQFGAVHRGPPTVA